MKKGGVCFFVQSSLAHSRAIKLKKTSADMLSGYSLKTNHQKEYLWKDWGIVT